MNKTVLYTETPAKIAKLFLYAPTGSVEEFVLSGPCVIGRKSAESKANIQINSPIVSRQHGEIAVLDGEYYFRDLGSMNGTLVNGVLYGKDSRRSAAKLENGDVLRIDQSNGMDRHTNSVLMIFSTVYSDSSSWVSQPLTDNIAEVNIGRAVQNGGLMIDNHMVSMNHASFFRYGGGWAIADHNSTNGVFVNNSRISGSVALQPLDVVRIVDTNFIFTGGFLLLQQEPVVQSVTPALSQPGQQGGSSLSIRITERSVWQKFKKLTLLQNINLTVNSGEMVLILGGSGAGKTTFMNAVMGYEKAEGQIFHGQTDIYNEYEQMKYEIGFVPQQDLLR